jgi:glycerol-3-phosphate acyltransferase PlsY
MLIILFSYLIGSIPSGLILSKLILGKDIRKHGSGNIGTTNAYRIGGKKLGILTLIADMSKAAIAVLAAELIYPENLEMKCLCGLAASVGHMYSAFMKLSGGKGVATSIMVLLLIHMPLALFTVSIFLPVVYFSRYVSLASIIASVGAAAASFGTHQQAVIATTWVMAILITIKHKENIKRLFSGTENKV